MNSGKHWGKVALEKDSCFVLFFLSGNNEKIAGFNTGPVKDWEMKGIKYVVPDIWCNRPRVLTHDCAYQKYPKNEQLSPPPPSQSEKKTFTHISISRRHDFKQMCLHNLPDLTLNDISPTFSVMFFEWLQKILSLWRRNANECTPPQSSPAIFSCLFSQKVWA